MAADSGTGPAPKSTKSCDIEFLKLTTPLCAAVDFDQPPKVGQDSGFTIKFWKRDEDRDENHKYFDPEDQIRVFLWMDDMGHGSSPIEIEKKETGILHAKRVYFTMPGKWTIRLQFHTGKTVLDEQKMEVVL